MNRRLITGAACLACILSPAALTGVVGAQEHAPSPALAVTAEPTATLTLANLEELATRNNPTLTQAAAQVEAARGRELQAGLYPNPTIGYESDRINASGSAGEG